MLQIPNLEVLKQAYERIREHINKTPVFTSSTLNNRTGGEVYLKCENFQKGGAFKFRGACNTVFSLDQKEAENGVVTHSSGNHAAALALAARLKGVPAYIVMPSNAPQVKKNAVENYGGRITLCEPTLEARETTAAKVLEETGGVLVHPYDDYRIIAGASSAANELLTEAPDLDYMLAPVGGGGLLSGTALFTKYTNKKIKVIAGEPEKADDAFRSFNSGKIEIITSTDTIADGLRTMLSEKTFGVISQYVDNIITVTEEEIVDAMKFVWERMKLIIEPSSAVPVAVLLSGKLQIKDKKAGVIISGGNVDLTKLPF